MFSFFKRSSKKTNNNVSKQQALQQQQSSLKQVLDQRKHSLDDNRKYEVFTDTNKNIEENNIVLTDQWDTKNSLPNSKICEDRAFVENELEIGQRSSSLPPVISASQNILTNSVDVSPTTHNSLFDIMAKGRNKKHKQNNTVNQKNQKYFKSSGNCENSVLESFKNNVYVGALNADVADDTIENLLEIKNHSKTNNCSSIEENFNEYCVRNVGDINSYAPTIAENNGATSSNDIVNDATASLERNFR